MKKLLFVVTATILLGTGCNAMGNHDMQSGQGMMSSMMMKMDTNGDGMLSKEEFMKGHEAMFDRMKGPNGMISLKDMQMKGMGMMGSGQPTPGMNQGTK